jgi:hypothetical protein
MAAYLARHGYLHDIFVSYSHGDVDQLGASFLKDWSTRFIDLLDNNLKTVLRQQVFDFLMTANATRTRSIDRHH